MKLPKKNGFTLLEVLILTVVGALAGGLLVSILVNNTGVLYQQTSRVSQGLDINDALTEFRSAVKESQAVISEYPEGSSPPDYQTSPNQLVLKMTVVNDSGTLIPNIFDYVVFFQEGDKLRFKVFADPLSIKGDEDIILAKEVSGVIFNYLDEVGQAVSPPTLAKKVKATIILSKKAGYEVETNVATSEASLRND